MNSAANLEVRLLGDMDLRRGGSSVALPRSKKTRALLAYLAVSGRDHRRDSLCLMFWDLPDDPRGSLRWSLSKLRPLVDEGETRRIQADRDRVRFDPVETVVDVLELRRAVIQGLRDQPAENLSRLAEAFRGEFLEGLELPNCPDFQAWLVAQRDETRGLRTQILRALVAVLGGETEAALPHARTLVQLNPHDEAAWIGLVQNLAATGRKREAEQQLDLARQAVRGLGPGASHALERAWRQIGARGETAAAPPSDPVPDVFDDSAPEPVTAREAGVLPLPEKPSIAVLAFATTGEEGTEPPVAEGIAADLIERLGHDPRLFVTARSSAFALRERPAHLAGVRDALGVRYVLEGEMRGTEADLSVNARLSDTVEGETVWSRDFNYPLDGVFALVRDLAEAVSRSIDPGAGGVPDLTFGLPHPSVDAWVLYQRGAQHLHERSHDDLDKALALFEKALDLDPGFTRAQAAAVDAQYYQVALDYVAPSQDWRAAALQRAREANESARRDAALFCALGQGHLLVRQPQVAITAFETAVELNPSFAWAHYGLGAAKVLSGLSSEAVPHLERAIRLSPRDRNMGSFRLRMADAHLFMCRYEEAVACARRAIEEPLFQWSRHAVLLSALGHLERHGEARAALDEVLRERPDFSIELVRRNHLYTDQVELDFVAEPQLFVDQNQFAHFLDGLRKAGVPTR